VSARFGGALDLQNLILVPGCRPHLHRATAERELEAIKGRREHLEKLERDNEALLETYAAFISEALGSLTPEERQKLYKILRLRVIVNLDGIIEVGGMFVDNLDVCTVEVSSSCLSTRRTRFSTAYLPHASGQGSTR
jgi:hypothetical protein